MNIVIKDVYTSKTFRVLTRLLESLTCDKEYADAGVSFYLHFNGERPYNFKPFPEYASKKQFADSDFPIRVYTVVAMCDKPISDEINKSIMHHARCFADLYEVE